MFENIAAVCSGVVKEQRRRLFTAEPRKCQHWSPESYRRSISVSSYIYIDICYESWAQLRLFLMILKGLKCWFWSTVQTYLNIAYLFFFWAIQGEASVWWESLPARSGSLIRNERHPILLTIVSAQEHKIWRASTRWARAFPMPSSVCRA